MKQLLWATLILMILSAVIIMVFAIFVPIISQINIAVRESANNTSSPNVGPDVNRITTRVDKTIIAVPIVFIIGLAFWYMMWGHKFEHGPY